MIKIICLKSESSRGLEALKFQREQRLLEADRELKLSLRFLPTLDEG